MPPYAKIQGCKRDPSSSFSYFSSPKVFIVFICSLTGSIGIMPPGYKFRAFLYMRMSCGQFGRAQSRSCSREVCSALIGSFRNFSQQFPSKTTLRKVLGLHCSVLPRNYKKQNIQYRKLATLDDATIANVRGTLRYQKQHLICPPST